MLLRLNVSTVEGQNTLRVRLVLDTGAEASVELTGEMGGFLDGRLHAEGSGAEIEKRNSLGAQYGAGLFSALKSNPAARALWAAAEEQIHSLRVEIDDPGGDVPWELLRAEPSARPLACRVQSFVRRAPGAIAAIAQAVRQPAGQPQMLRVLFVVPRIRGGEGSVFHSTALRLVNGLCATCRDYFQLDWLSAPSFEQLERQLRQARESGKPYHVVHYDGHGMVALDEGGTGEPGFLILEGANQAEAVSGRTFSRLLAENKVAVLTLNAAYQGAGEAREARRAFQAAAVQALECGVPGVLVLPEVLDAGTAAKTMGDIYAALAQGESLGAAVGAERRFLYGANPGLDWAAPLVFESQAVQVAPRVEVENAPIFRISIMPMGQERFPAEMDAALRAKARLEGLEGGDERLLVLDQAFDANRIVLCSGPDEAANSAAAAEYARWQGNTGALGGQPVLYTSLRDCFCFTDLLENFGQVYEKALHDRGVLWQALNDLERGKLIQDLVKKMSLFWIWDHCGAMLSSAPGGWDEDELRKLVEFLRAFPGGMGRILLLAAEALPPLEEIVLGLYNPEATRADGQRNEILRGFSASERRWLALASSFGSRIDAAFFSEIAPVRKGAISGERVNILCARAASAGVFSSRGENLFEVQPAAGLLLGDMRRSYLGEKQFGRWFVRAAAAWARRLANPAHGYPGALLEGENGLRAALEIALRNGWHGPAGDILAVLGRVMIAQRKYAPWARLLERSAGLYLSPRAGKMRLRKGREETGMKLIADCVAVSRLRGLLSEARGWQTMRLDFLRRSRGPAAEQDLGTAIALLAELHLAAGSPAAIDALREGYRLARRKKFSAGMRDIAYRIAGAYTQLAVGKNLHRARRWISIYRGWLAPDDAVGQARSALLEGKIAYERFLQAQKENAKPPRLVEYLNEALGCTFEGLEMLPADERQEAARAHEMLGFLYLQASQMVDEAVGHYDRAIALFQDGDDTASASRARFNLAVALALLGDNERAQRYTAGALRGYEALGAEFLGDAQKARRLLDRLAGIG